MTSLLLNSLLILESGWAAVLLLLLVPALTARSWRPRRNRKKLALRAEIHKMLAVYVGGNPDTTKLQAMLAAHPEQFQDALQQFQTAISGRTEALGDLAFRIGLVSRWCDIAQSGPPQARRMAFQRVASAAHYAPARRLATELALQASSDPDAQIRFAAAQVLLHTDDSWQIARLFERLLSETVLIRCLIGPELRPYAGQLCRNIVPEVMRNIGPGQLVNALQLMASWERGLPLAGLGHLAKHPDAAVRLAFMQMLPLLPAVLEYRKALLEGLADANPRVRRAAVAAAQRLGITRNPDPAVSGAIQQALGTACVGEVA